MIKEDVVLEKGHLGVGRCWFSSNYLNFYASHPRSTPVLTC